MWNSAFGQTGKWQRASAFPCWCTWIRDVPPVLHAGSIQHQRTFHVPPQKATASATDHFRVSFPPSLGEPAAVLDSIIFRVQQHPQVPNFTQCVTFGFFPTPGLETAYNLFCVIAMYFLPLMIISGAYTVILCEISNRSREKETSDSNTTGTLRLRCNDLTHIERARQRTLRLTITIVVVFVWCWTPYVVMTLWYMFDRESASKVDVAVQDGLFLMAVSNSCMNPLVYGSYAMKCRLPCRRRNTPGGVQTPNAAQRRSTDAVSGIIGPHSDRLTGRDNKDELLVADQRSITMNHLSQNGGIALLQSTGTAKPKADPEPCQASTTGRLHPSQLRSTGGVALTTGAGASSTVVGTTTATTRFYNRFSSGITNGTNYHTNTSRLISGGIKPATSIAHRKAGGEKVTESLH
ncbi:hypothetical protein ZHAS_00013242 [Anopheles sinensis]|uniref:G_PROTEIN_RECEP_F1_2 domain-containing protein n=1 Tax=Anopheles sinensis TaxID=74873 RepID=A0A084W503_ANOSI|nr:hypothetical protein ZHAS_00013242 [Anopheles sinensis]